LEWAQANYQLLISADDYLLPKALLRAATLMDVHPEVGFAFGRYVELREGNLIKRPGVLSSVAEDEWHIMSGIDFIRRSGPSNIVGALTAVVRTEMQKQVGGYRSEIPHTADMEMWLRLATGAAVGFIGSYQAVYRVHGSNMSVSYCLGSGLRDFAQRRDALRCFFDWSGERLPNAVRMRDEFYCGLARQATGRASAAFHRGDIDECNELLEFALDTWRDIKKSSCWFKLALKRRMGLRAWRAIRTLLPR
jgi:hypothetical protein